MIGSFTLHYYIIFQHISPYQLPRCLGAHYLVYKQNSKKAALRWSTRVNQVYPKLVEPYQRRAPFFGFCLQVFRQHTSPHRLDYLARLGNERKVCFARTQRRIASLGIEPEASNLSITNLTLYQLSSQPSSLYIGVDAEVWFMPGVPFLKFFQFLVISRRDELQSCRFALCVLTNTHEKCRFSGPGKCSLTRKNTSSKPVNCNKNFPGN